MYNVFLKLLCIALICLFKAESERLVGGLFEEISEKQSSIINSISMVGPDSGFINLLRYGMLALRLLPNCNLSSMCIN